MSVADNIGYSLRVAGVPRSTREARVKTVADSLGLAEFLRRKPGQLSCAETGRRERAARASREKIFMSAEWGKEGAAGRSEGVACHYVANHGVYQNPWRVKILLLLQRKERINISGYYDALPLKRGRIFLF